MVGSLGDCAVGGAVVDLSKSVQFERRVYYKIADIAEAMVASRCPCNLRMKEFPEHCGEDCCKCWGKSILNEWGGKE